MEEKREREPSKPDATREWLLQLEQRVGALEREAARRERRRRRSTLYLLLAGVVYVAFLFWEMNRALP